MGKKVSLALSGGGVRGAAHIGVLKRLQELNIEVSFISGTSAGAIVGAFFADEFSAQEIEELFIKSKFTFEINFLKFATGLLSPKKLEELLKKHLKSKTFAELKTKLFVCVTNYETGEAKYLDSGDLQRAVLASSALPVIYEPVRINDIIYVDGGISRNLPTEPLVKFDLPIIGVHVNPLHIGTAEKTLMQKVDHIVHLSLVESLRNSAKACALLIEPEKLLEHSIFDTVHLKEIIEIGYQKAKQELSPQKLSEIWPG